MRISSSAPCQGRGPLRRIAVDIADLQMGRVSGKETLPRSLTFRHQVSVEKQPTDITGTHGRDVIPAARFDEPGRGLEFVSRMECAVGRNIESQSAAGRDHQRPTALISFFAPIGRDGGVIGPFGQLDKRLDGEVTSRDLFLAAKVDARFRCSVPDGRIAIGFGQAAPTDNLFGKREVATELTVNRVLTALDRSALARPTE